MLTKLAATSEKNQNLFGAILARGPRGIRPRPSASASNPHALTRLSSRPGQVQQSVAACWMQEPSQQSHPPSSRCHPCLASPACEPLPLPPTAGRPASVPDSAPDDVFRMDNTRQGKSLSLLVQKIQEVVIGCTVACYTLRRPAWRSHCQEALNELPTGHGRLPDVLLHVNPSGQLPVDVFHFFDCLAL